MIMDLFFKKNINISIENLHEIKSLSKIQQDQFVEVAKAFWGVDISFSDDFIKKYSLEYSEIFEFGIKNLSIFDKANIEVPLYDAWSNNIDAVMIFHHNTTNEGDVLRVQGGFEAFDRENTEHVNLAKALDKAAFEASDDDTP